MSEYTPTTEEIVRKFATGATWQHQSYAEAEAEIRRWLAAHDAEVQAQVVAEEPEWEYVPGWIVADGRARISQGVIAPIYVADFIAEGGEVVRRRVSKFETVTADMVPAEQEGAETDA